MAVSELIDDAKDYVADLTGDASLAFANYTNRIDSYYPKMPPASTANAPQPPDLGESPEAPQFDLVGVEPGAAPTAPKLMDVPNDDGREAPTFNIDPPELEFPDRPADLDEFKEPPPKINLDVAFPELPDALTVPVEAPVVRDVVMPTKPGNLTVPEFNAERPRLTAQPPQNVVAKFETSHSDHALEVNSNITQWVDAWVAEMAPAFHSTRDKMTSRLEGMFTGGTGIDPTIEEAIYARARERNDLEAKRLVENVRNEAAGMGFSIPSGALNSQIQRARQEAANNNNKTSNEIIIKRLEMEQEMIKFAITATSTLYTSVLQAALAYHQHQLTLNAQALDFAKSIRDTLFETYNNELKAFAAVMDLYKAEAAVYEAKMRAVGMLIDVYKAELDAARMEVEIDKTLVDAYRSRIDALNSVANIYRVQVDAVLGKANLEKAKIEVFQAQVQAYNAQVQAKSAEWQGYQAAISGETAKMSGYTSQAQAYSAEVGGFSAAVQAKSERVRAIASANQALSSQFAAEVQAFQADVSAQAQVAQANTENIRQRLVAFQGEVQADIGRKQLQLEQYKTLSQVALQNAQGDNQIKTANLQAQTQVLATMATVAEGEAKMYSTLAGAALAGMNVLVSESTQGE